MKMEPKSFKNRSKNQSKNESNFEAENEAKMVPKMKLKWLQSSTPKIKERDNKRDPPKLFQNRSEKERTWRNGTKLEPE